MSYDDLKRLNLSAFKSNDEIKFEIINSNDMLNDNNYATQVILDNIEKELNNYKESSHQHQSKFSINSNRSNENNLILKNKNEKEYIQENNELPSFNFDVGSKIIFQSENGTILDFQNYGNNKINLSFHFDDDNNNNKIVFQNITFSNYNNDRKNESLFQFSTKNEHNKYEIIFDNCTFDHIQSYFRNIIGYDQEDFSTFITSFRTNNRVNIINSKLEDIYIKVNKPLFNLDYTSLNNCHTYNDHLIHFYYPKTKSLQIIIENSKFKDIDSLIDGVVEDLVIKNSTFNDIISHRDKPALMNLKYSNIEIIDGKFLNITTFGPLFNEKSIYSIKNSVFKDITTNSKTLIYVEFNDLLIENCSFNNIILNGDADYSSLINFYSNEYGNSFTIKTTNFYDNVSNGEFIIINGDNSNVIFTNMTVNNIHSYGSLIKNKSLK
ncbi:hypothetical protein PIROE2DRAFT_16695, partial [Piromyces sp. E2]